MIFTHGYRKLFRAGKLADTAGCFDHIGMKPGKLDALCAPSMERDIGVLRLPGLATRRRAPG
jgi:putative oxidoreductase